MKTRIEIFRTDNRKNVVASGEWNRILSSGQIRKEKRLLMRHLDPKKHSSRIIVDNNE